MQHHTQVTILQELMRQLDAGQNIDAGVQYRMPTKDYVCLDRAQQEQQHFFRDHPHVVGLSNDLTGNGSLLEQASSFIDDLLSDENEDNDGYYQ